MCTVVVKKYDSVLQQRGHFIQKPKLLKNTSFHRRLSAHGLGESGKVLLQKQNCNGPSNLSDINILKFLGSRFCFGIAIDVLQCFSANCVYGGRNRLQIAV